jgi:FKBP-type peptidyl-prolyl cis-trans isomerase SlyD
MADENTDRTIAKGKVATIDYTLTNDAGQVLDSSQGREPLTYLHGGGLIPGMERALEGRSAGEHFQVTIPPEQGYGEKDPNMVQPVPRSNFAGVPHIEKGMQFQARSPDGHGARVVTVVDVSPDTVTVDANHPLAGETLHFDVSVKEVREASPEELSHGHAHGPGGHHH